MASLNDALMASLLGAAAGLPGAGGAAGALLNDAALASLLQSAVTGAAGGGGSSSGAGPSNAAPGGAKSGIDPLAATLQVRLGLFVCFLLNTLRCA